MDQPTKKEIEAIIDQCSDLENSNESMYPGMTYEQGVKAALEWRDGNYGQFNESPLE